MTLSSNQSGVSRDDFLKLVQHSEIPVNERYGMKKRQQSKIFVTAKFICE